MKSFEEMDGQAFLAFAANVMHEFARRLSEMALEDQTKEIKVVHSLPTLRSLTRRKNKPWEEWEIAFIIDNYMKPGHTASLIGKALGRSPATVTEMARKLRMKGAIGMKINRPSKCVTIPGVHRPK